MPAQANHIGSASIRLPSPTATERLAQSLASRLAAGDVVLLEGPIGAGKSHFCRAAIRHLLHQEGRDEDIPSPTFTLVQSYDLREMEVWHADLYRLTDPVQVIELGLEEAFGAAVVFVEWPDRLGDMVPANALTLALEPIENGEARLATFTAGDPRWSGFLASLKSFAPGDIP